MKRLDFTRQSHADLALNAEGVEVAGLGDLPAMDPSPLRKDVMATINAAVHAQRQGVPFQPFYG